MNDLERLPKLPPPAKLFVALFTSLMLAVCVWAVWIYTVEKGESGDADYEVAVEEEIGAIAEDSLAVHAPVWDTVHAGREEQFDSSEINSMRRQAGLPESEDAPEGEEYEPEEDSQLRRNLGLAHVHVNGQTLLFFALGAVFLFTTVRARTKKIVLWMFGVSILAHAVGLSGEGFGWFFDVILAISGVIILLLVVYMCFMIYVDLGRKRTA